MKKFIVPLLTVAVVVAVFLAGCMPAAPPPVTPPPVTPPPVTPPPVTPPVAPPEEVEPIVMGLAAMLTGPYAADGEVSRRGVGLAMEEINAAGGLLGRPLEMVQGDTGAWTAEEIRSAVTYLMTYDPAVFFTPYCSDPAFMEVFGSLDIPMLHVSAMSLYEEIYASNPDYYWNVIMADGSEKSYGPAAFTAMTEVLPYEFPNKKAAVLSVEWDYALSVAESFIEFSEGHGWETVMHETFPWGTSEFGVLLAKIRAENPAIIFLNDFSAAGPAAFITQYLEDPTDSLIYCQYAPSVPEFRELLGDKSIGILWQSLAVEAPGPKSIAFDQSYTARWGESPLGTVGSGCYDIVYIWAKAVEAVGDVRDYRGIYDYIMKTPYEGVVGTYVFNRETNSCLVGNDYIAMKFHQIQPGPEGPRHVLLILGDIPQPGAEFIMPPWLEGE